VLTYHCYITEILSDRSVSSFSYSSLTFLLLFSFFSSSCLFLGHFAVVFYRLRNFLDYLSDTYKKESMKVSKQAGVPFTRSGAIAKRKNRCSHVIVAWSVSQDVFCVGGGWGAFLSWLLSSLIRAGIHIKAVFWLGITFLTQTSRSRFKQSRISMLISHIYVFGRFVNFLVILGIFGDK